MRNEALSLTISQLSNGGTNIYITTLAPGSVNSQNCSVPGGTATPYCAVKLTQATLNWLRRRILSFEHLAIENPRVYEFLRRSCLDFGRTMRYGPVPRWATSQSLCESAPLPNRSKWKMLRSTATECRPETHLLNSLLSESAGWHGGESFTAPWVDQFRPIQRG
jgi:hypothetical protein